MPEKFQITGQQMQIDTPIQILDLENGQNHLPKNKPRDKKKFRQGVVQQ
jgi:hypothetical protein